MTATFTLTGDLEPLVGSSVRRSAYVELDQPVIDVTNDVTYEMADRSTVEGAFALTGLPARNPLNNANGDFNIVVTIGKRKWLVPAQAAGSTHDINEFLETTGLVPVTPNQYLEIQAIVDGIPATLATLAGPAVAAATAAGGFQTVTRAPSLAKNRVPDPQMKTTGGSTSNAQMPVTRITTGLPTGFAYGVQTSRASTLSAVIANLSNGANNAVLQPTAATPVTPTETISASAYGYTDQASARARLDIYWYKADFTPLTTSAGTYGTLAGSTWERRFRSGVVVPATAAYAVLVMVIATASGNTVTGAVARGTGFQIVDGTDPAPAYADGALTDGWYFEGTPHLSASRQVNLPASVATLLPGLPARVATLEGAGGVTPLTVVKAGNVLTFTSKRGATTVANQATMNGSSNGAYSIEGDLYAGASFRPGTDEVCPIRTQMSTVGANHGYPNVASFTNPDGKNATDLGSLWTDGTRHYRILAIVGGLPIVGGRYGSQQQLVLNGATALTLSVTNSGGTQATSSIATPASVNVQAALVALSNVGAGKATVTSSNGVLTILFDNTLGVTTATITASTGTTPTITPVMTWSPIVAPTTNLTHVSGATHTAAMDYTTKVATQLYPSIGRVQVRLFVDGSEVTTDGTYQCAVSEVRETYDVLDYASIYDTAGSNIGTSYATLAVAGAVRVSNTFRYRPGGLLEVDLTLDELKPTALGSCGAIQSAPPTAPTRYLPGVGAADGVNWTTGVDMSTYSTDNTITASERAGTLAPTFSLDVNATAAWTMGYLPNGRRGDEQSTGVKRLAQSADPLLWDMRGTDKNYPVFIDGRVAGWGRVSANAFRSMLTTTEATTVLASKGDVASAFAALDAILALTR